MANRSATITPRQAQEALLSLANGAGIGQVALKLGLHHQTLKRLLLAHDADAFTQVYQPAPKQQRTPPQPPAPAPAVLAQRDEVAQIQRELAAGRTIREVAKARSKSVKQIAALLPSEVVAEVAPAQHAQQEQEKKKAAVSEALRLLQMEMEPAEVVKRVEGLRLEKAEEMAAYCKSDTLGSRWALKTFGCFTCHTGTGGTIHKLGVTLPAVWVQCRCGKQQWKAAVVLAMGVAACEACGSSR